MKALRVELTGTLAYWTVVDDDWVPVALADAYLRHLRLGADRAEGTTRAYAGDLACYLGWCEVSGRDLLSGAAALGMFVVMLKTTPVARAGSGRAGSGAGPDQPRPGPGARALQDAVADRALDASVLTLLFEVGDDRHLPAELRLEGSGLRYLARPRHVQRPRRAGLPVPVRREEAEALVRAARSWRDRFLLVLLWFCGLRVGEALGLRRSDLHLVPTAAQKTYRPAPMGGRSCRRHRASWFGFTSPPSGSISIGSGNSNGGRRKLRRRHRLPVNWFTLCRTSG